MPGKFKECCQLDKRFARLLHISTKIELLFGLLLIGIS